MTTQRFAWLRRVDYGLTVGFVAFALTLTVPWWPESTTLAVIGMPLAIGMFFGSAPFGGPHNASGDAFIMLSALINGSIWFGILRIAGFIRDMRRQK